MPGRRQRDEGRPDRWFTRQDAARAFSIDVKSFDVNYRPMFTEDCWKHEDGRLWFDLRRCIDAYCAAKVRRGTAQVMPKDVNQEDGDEDEQVPSEALERMREEKVKILKLQRFELEKQIIPRDVVHRTWTMLAAKLRAFGGFIQREHGRQALEEFNSVLDDCGREYEAAFGESQ